MKMLYLEVRMALDLWVLKLGGWEGKGNSIVLGVGLPSFLLKNIFELFFLS